MRRSSRILGVSLVLLGLLASLIWYAVLAEERGGMLTVAFLDVGQGDAVFIDAPSGRQLLIDGGAGVSLLRQLPRVMPWWDRSIDVVVATHPDKDHIGGLIDMLPRYRVATVVTSSVEGDTAEWDTFMRLAHEEGAHIIEAKRGQVLELGRGARFEFLFPDRPVPGLETNTGSVVGRLVYGETAFMLTGDSPSGVEEYLAALARAELDTSDGSLQADVLKVGHHGSKTSSSPIFLGFVDPQFAVFSRGCDNSYGHPSPEVVERFAQFQIPTFDTCKEGTITFISDGKIVQHIE